MFEKSGDKLVYNDFGKQNNWVELPTWEQMCCVIYLSFLEQRSVEKEKTTNKTKTNKQELARPNKDCHFASGIAAMPNGILKYTRGRSWNRM